MSYLVNWTSRAEYTFDQNIQYLDEEWSNSVLNQFPDKVEAALEKISDNPFLYPLDKPSKNIRRCIINGRIILYYRIIDDENPDLLLFCNTHQNPEKLQF